MPSFAHRKRIRYGFIVGFIVGPSAPAQPKRQWAGDSARTDNFAQGVGRLANDSDAPMRIE